MSSFERAWCLWPLALAACVVPGFDPTGKGCDGDHACPSGFVCVAGACLPGRVACALDDDCLSGEACSAGACRTCGGEVPCPSVCYPDLVLDDAPRVYWRLGELDGGPVRDASGHGVDGMATVAVTPGAPGAIAGDPDTATTFDGGHIFGSTLVDVGGDFSVEAWFKGRSSSRGGVIGLFYQSNGLPTRTLAIDNQAFLGQTMIDTEWPQYTVTTGRVDMTAWHHLVFTVHDTTELVLYVDGAEAVRRTVAPTATFGSGPTVGWSGVPWANPLNFGTVDEVALYDRVLPAGRVLRHFQAAAPRSALDTGAGCCRDAECTSGACVQRVCVSR